MRRREFVTLLGGAAAWPLPARAEQLFRLGVLTGRGREEPNFMAFFDELRQFGIVEGQHLTYVNDIHSSTKKGTPGQLI
jgi:hypothetical protein